MPRVNVLFQRIDLEVCRVVGDGQVEVDVAIHCFGNDDELASLDTEISDDFGTEGAYNPRLESANTPDASGRDDHGEFVNKGHFNYFQHKR